MATILFKWLILPFVSFFHPFFIGITEIQHNKTEKTLEISVKLFVDDFENALTQKFNTPVDLANPKNINKTNEQVAAYIQQFLHLKVNGKPVQLEYVGFEHEREAAWCYLQVSNIESVLKIEIENKLLYNVLDKQINLMHVTVNGQRKSTKISYPESLATFTF